MLPMLSMLTRKCGKTGVRNNSFSLTKLSIKSSEIYLVRIYLSVKFQYHIFIDVVNIESIALSGRGFGLVNLCSGRGRTLENLGTQWLTQINPRGKIKLNLNALPYRRGEPMSFWGSSKKFELLNNKNAPQPETNAFSKLISD